ncbi:hypothetical protein, partial [Rhodococcus baikonurensis]|uniref:hypothetical protein n=1 Tax=Rhodococcus baikonurensis TaxID=172041 RepID=UPI003393E235
PFLALLSGFFIFVLFVLSIVAKTQIPRLWVSTTWWTPTADFFFHGIDGKSTIERVSVDIVSGTSSYRAWHFFK